MRFTKLVLKKIPESFGLVLVAG